MSGIGGVSGGGGSGGGAPAAGGADGAGGAQAVTPAAGASDSGDFSGGNGAVKAVGDDAGTNAPPSGCSHGQVNTQNFIQMRNSSVQQVNEAQSPDMDLKKIIEMMMAIKLLQEINKS